MDIRQSFETCRQRCPHVRLALEARAPGLVAARHLQHAVVGEKRHDAVEIMRVEGVANLFQRRADIHRRTS
jgi:hypothetical protein